MSRKLKRFKRLVRRPFEWLGIGLGWLVFAHVSHRMLFRICDDLFGVIRDIGVRPRFVVLLVVAEDLGLQLFKLFGDVDA